MAVRAQPQPDDEYTIRGFRSEEAEYTETLPEGESAWSPEERAVVAGPEHVAAPPTHPIVPTEHALNAPGYAQPAPRSEGDEPIIPRASQCRRPSSVFDPALRSDHSVPPSPPTVARAAEATAIAANGGRGQARKTKGASGDRAHQLLLEADRAALSSTSFEI